MSVKDPSYATQIKEGETYAIHLDGGDLNRAAGAIWLIYNFASTCFEGEKDTMTEEEEQEYIDAFDSISDFVDFFMGFRHRE